MPTDCMWGVFYSAFPALCVVVDQLVWMYLIDVAIGKAETSPNVGYKGDSTVLAILVATFVLNYAMRHFANTKFRHLKLGGKAALSLRTALFDTMIQFTSESQERFSAGDVATAINREVPEAVLNADTRRKQLFRGALRRNSLVANSPRNVQKQAKGVASILIRDLSFEYPPRPTKGIVTDAEEAGDPSEKIICGLTTVIPPDRIPSARRSPSPSSPSRRSSREWYPSPAAAAAI
eukprot:gene14225-1985_t